MRTASAADFIAALPALEKLLRATLKNRASLASHRFYAPKARAALATVRKNFSMLKRDYPEERFPRVAFQLTAIEPLVGHLVAVFPSQPREMLRLTTEIAFKVASDLAAELDAPEATPELSTSAPFLPDDLVEVRHGVLHKVLWEANRCYDAACYNGCAALIRRLIESLIIEAFEKLGIDSRIKKDGDYLDLGALIGKAVAEPTLRLTRNTKRVLPDLKFFGDMAAHNRMALVRKADLDRLHNQIRAGIEELARHS